MAYIGDLWIPNPKTHVKTLQPTILVEQEEKNVVLSEHTYKNLNNSINVLKNKVKTLEEERDYYKELTVILSNQINDLRQQNTENKKIKVE